MLINIINRAISLILHLTKLSLSLIICGVCFVVMLVCVLIILHGDKDPTIWSKRDRK